MPVCQPASNGLRPSPATAARGGTPDDPRASCAATEREAAARLLPRLVVTGNADNSVRLINMLSRRSKKLGCSILLYLQIAAPCFPGIDTPYVMQRSQRSSDCSRETLASSIPSATTVAHQPYYSYRRASPFRCTANSAPMSNACRVKGAGQGGARSAVSQ